MAQEPLIEAFFDEATHTVTYLIADPASRRAAILDSVLDFDEKSGRTATRSADAVLAKAKALSLTVDWILETHAHADHLTAAVYLKEQTGARVAIGVHIRDVQCAFKPVFNAADVKCDGAPFDVLFEDGAQFQIGELAVDVLHTPGHTPACIAYKTGNNVFVGDTLFMPDYGTARCDFPGGDPRTLYRSIRRLLALPPETVLWLCHDYKSPARQDYAWRTTVAAERADNIHVHNGVSEEAFVAMRSARDKTLSMPALILPSVQVNMRAGHFPPAESDGKIYLKLPVNRL